jgi:diguanylate cyclase (GGDEF)-like protein
MAIDRTKLKTKAGEYEQRSITDSLTGLRNRGYLEERLMEEISQARRYRSSMCLLMIDVDHFKLYNDNFGHPAGDHVLKLIAHAFRETLRTADVAARYGGEEFAILLPHTSGEEASVIAERIRQRVERTEFPHRGVTISIGVAGYSKEFEEPKDWITAADMALYEAKEQGRNITRVYEDLGRSFKEKIN